MKKGEKTMFGNSNKKKLLAVADGMALPLEDVPDPAFSGKMLGDGFAVEPSVGVFYSPVDGRVESVTDTRHAYSIRSDDGLDILVHIGIDTVELKGKGFSSLVAAGDRVKAGEPIARADLDLIRAGGLPTITPVLVSNTEELGAFELSLGEVKGGASAVLRYRK